MAAAIQIGQVAAGVHLFTGKLAGIAICIFDNTAFRICLIDNIGIGTVVVQHSAGYVIGAKRGRIHAGCYGAVAESGGIGLLTAKGQGIAAGGFAILTDDRGALAFRPGTIADGYGVFATGAGADTGGQGIGAGSAGVVICNCIPDFPHCPCRPSWHRW